MYARTQAKTSTDSKPSNLPLGRSLAQRSSLLVPEHEMQSLAERDRDYSPEPSPTVPLNRPGRGFSFGNLAIGPQERLGIQAKLTIGQPHDRYEQEADHVADRVMRMPTSTTHTTPVNAIGQPSIQRLCPECEEELQRQPKQSEEDEKKKKRLQMQPLGGTITPVPLLQRQAKPPQTEDEEKKKRLQKKATSEASPDLAPDLQEHLSSLQQGGGQPLSPTERSFFEPRFGHDFSPVKIHTDERAADMARSVNARAFTIGRDVVFGAGQYQLRSTEGKRLLAHELTHVVQQGGAELQRKPRLEQCEAHELVHNIQQTNSKQRLQRISLDECTSPQETAVRNAHTRAVAMLDTAITKLGTYNGTTPADVRDSLDRNFHATSSPFSGWIRFNLRYLRLFVNLPQYECHSVQSIPNPAWTMWCVPFTDIELYPNWFSKGLDLQAKILIHEWVHHYGCNFDLGYQSDPEYARHSTTRSLFNADPWAWLVYDIR